MLLTRLPTRLQHFPDGNIVLPVIGNA